MSKKPVKKKTPAKKKAAKPKCDAPGISKPGKAGEAVAKYVQGMAEKGESAESFEARKKKAREQNQKLFATGAEITDIQPHADGNGVDVFFNPNIEDEGATFSNIIKDQAPGVSMEGLSTLERMFIYCYTTNNGNGTQAAKDAGYAAIKDNTFAAIAYENLRKPHIKREIERIMTEKVMPKEEALKRFSDMARANINDYLRVVQKPVRPMVKTSLHVLIAEMNAKIEDQRKFIDRLTERKVKDTRLVAYRDEITMWQEQVIRWEIALERNPLAVEEREGPEQLEEVIELDMVKLARDKEKGLIKTFKPGKNGGWEIELYGADGALVNIGRYHGIFDKDNVRLNLHSEPLTKEEIQRIAGELEDKF